MINDKIVNELSLVVSDYLNNVKTITDYKKKINGILHNKSNATVIKELCTFLKNKTGNIKNKAMVILVIALLCRNSDSILEIKELVQKYELTNNLYGGLLMMLAGNTHSFTLYINANGDKYKNKYEYIKRFLYFEYFKHYVFLKTIELLYLLDKNKFEILAYKDKGKIILLYVVSGYLNITPSDSLIKKLLISNDDLSRNIGLYFATYEVTKAVDDYCRVTQLQSHKNTSTELKNIEGLMVEKLKKCNGFLECCSKEVYVELMFNYILVHKERYPKHFAYKLMCKGFQSLFIQEIKSSDKIRTLQELYIITELITNTPALDTNNRRVSKIHVFMAITELLLNLISERKLYFITEYEVVYLEKICSNLPSKCVKKLYRSLDNIRKSLMCEEIDRLIRNKIYMEDKRLADVIDETLRCIAVRFNKVVF